MVQNFRLGFQVAHGCWPVGSSYPSPVEVTEVHTNSEATTGESGALKSSSTSEAQCACTSPVTTIGLRTSASTHDWVTRARDAR